MQDFTISVVGWNQAATLAACFDSLSAFEHVIYHDSDSTDESVLIASRYPNVTILPGGDKDNGSKCRNQCADACETKWLGWISTDDVMKSTPDEYAAAIAQAESVGAKGINVRVQEKNHDHYCYQPRLYLKECKWHGRAHEYLDSPLNCDSSLLVVHTRGPWHDKQTDPLHIMRCMWADMQDDPTNPRWVYYYAREHYYRGEWGDALYWFNQRISMGGFSGEVADALLFVARCYWILGDTDQACFSALKAVGVNANFKEALSFLATVVDGENGQRWKQMADTANNSGVLFVR